MVTLLFILIAYAIRKKYLPEDASRGDKLLYYLFCVFLTPLIGPWVYSLQDNAGSGEKAKRIGCDLDALC